VFNPPDFKLNTDDWPAQQSKSTQLWATALNADFFKAAVPLPAK